MSFPVKIRSTSLFVLTLILLTACGQKRALYLPEQPESNVPSQNTKTAIQTDDQGKH